MLIKVNRHLNFQKPFLGHIVYFSLFKLVHAFTNTSFLLTAYPEILYRNLTLPNQAMLQE